MKSIRASVKNHPVLSFFVLVFVIGWGGILILAGGPGGIPANQEQFEMLMPWVLLVWLAGPSVAGILLTGLIQGIMRPNRTGAGRSPARSVATPAPNSAWPGFIQWWQALKRRTTPFFCSGRSAI